MKDQAARKASEAKIEAQAAEEKSVAEKKEEEQRKAEEAKAVAEKTKKKQGFLVKRVPFADASPNTEATRTPVQEQQASADTSSKLAVTP